MNKKQRQYEITDQLIKNTYIELLRVKSSAKVSITDICKKSKINRSSFYLHYTSIEELVDSIEDETFSFLVHCADEYHYDTFTEEMLVRFFSLAMKYQEEFEYIYVLSEGKARKRYHEYIWEKTLAEWKKNSELSEYELILSYDYINAGCDQVLKTWIESGFQQPEKTKETIDVMVKHGLYERIYSKGK